MLNKEYSSPNPLQDVIRPLSSSQRQHIRLSDSMAGKKSRGKRSNNPPNTGLSPLDDRISAQTETVSVDVPMSQEISTKVRHSSRNTQPQSSQTNAASSRESPRLSSSTMSPTNPFQPIPKMQGHKKITSSVLTYHAVNTSSPRTVKSSDSRMVPSKLRPERLMLRHNASGASLRRDYLVPSSLPETVKQPWEKGDSGGEGEEDVATGSKWARKGSGECEDVEKSRARAVLHDIGFGSMDMASDSEKDVCATKHYKVSHLYSAGQRSPSYALDRSYSSQASSPHQLSIPSFPTPRLLPTHMSAFEYAMGPFLDNSPTHHGRNLVLPSPTTASFASSEPSVPANPPSTAQSFWSHRMEQLYEAPSPEQGLPEFLKGTKTLGSCLRHLTLKVALLRCAVLVRLIETSHHNDFNPPNPVDSSDGLCILTTPRSRSRGSSRPRAGSRTHSRLKFPNSHSDAFDSDSDEDVKTENYEAWSKVHTLAYRIAYPVAQRLGHQGLQARCLYWVGRAERGLGNWENARKAFEKVGLYGVTNLSSNEKDWEFWLQSIRVRDMGDESLGIDMNGEEHNDGNEEQKQEENQMKDFEKWEWDYITHGVLRKYKAVHHRKHHRIRDQAIPVVMSPISRHLSPFPTRSPADWYQEHAFSPWDQILDGGRGGEISLPRENLGDIFETVGYREDTEIEDLSLEIPHARGDAQPPNMGC